jgi:hypothetical protein
MDSVPGDSLCDVACYHLSGNENRDLVGLFGDTRRFVPKESDDLEEHDRKQSEQYRPEQIIGNWLRAVLACTGRNLTVRPNAAIDRENTNTTRTGEISNVSCLVHSFQRPIPDLTCSSLEVRILSVQTKSCVLHSHAAPRARRTSNTHSPDQSVTS